MGDPAGLAIQLVGHHLVVGDKGTYHGSATHAFGMVRPQLPGTILFNMHQLHSVRGLCDHLTMRHGRTLHGVVEFR